MTARRWWRAAVGRRRLIDGESLRISRLRAQVDHGFACRLIHTIGGGYMLSAEAVAVR